MILILILLVSLSCSKSKYTIIAENNADQKIVLLFGDKVDTIIPGKIEYIDSFRKGNYDWELWGYKEDYWILISNGKILLNQDKVLFVSSSQSGEYLYEWR